jgi:HPt (histidine-containing phosphotransfer) domain-containing protein
MRDKLAAIREGFLRRVRHDADALFECWAAKEPKSLTVLTRIRNISHGLAGAAGIFGYPRLGNAAATLEEAVVIQLDGADTLGNVERALERLLTGLDATCSNRIERPRRQADA